MDPLEQISRLALQRRASLAALARADGLSPEDAVDCVQEALCTLLTRTDQLPADPADWHASLTTIVRNRRRRSYLAQPHVELTELATETQPTDEALLRAEQHVRLRACVDELCEVQKAVVTLRMLEEQPGEDVAHALGISPGHVAVLLHRAKHALRSCMTGA